MAHNCPGDPKETLKWWQWGNVVLVSMKQDYNSKKNSMNSGCPGGGGGGGGGGGDGGPYVVMEHTPKPQQKLRQTLHFSVQVVVGSGFFSHFSFP